MSFEEVEMGLPPVNEVYSPPPPSLPPYQRQQQPQQHRKPYNSPGRNNYEDVETDTANSSLERDKTKPGNKNARIPEETSQLFQVRPVRNESFQQRRPPTPRRLPTPPLEGVYSLEETSDIDDENERHLNVIDRARKYGGFVLILLPGIFGVLIIQFIKYLLNEHPVHIISLCIFQGILYPSAFFMIYAIYWMKKSVFKVISCKTGDGWRNLGYLIVLGIFASTAVILQIVSFLHIDITVSLAITFTPLIFVALLEHISFYRKFSIELIFTTFVAYTGLVVLSMAALSASDPKVQKRILAGISTAIGSMTLAIPSSLILHKLRRNKVEDSLTATIFSFIGTLISLIVLSAYGIIADKTNYDVKPGIIAAVIAFTLCATLFQNLDSFYRTQEIENPIIYMLSATRMEIFIFSGIWEILKRGIFSGEFLFPSVFSIFGVILIVLSYALTLGFQAWYKNVVVIGNNVNNGQIEDNNQEKIKTRPFEFFPWLFSRSFISWDK